MSKVQMLKLILQLLQEKGHKNSKETDSAKVKLPEVAHIEDDIFMRELWCKSLSKKVILHQFKSPEAFNKHLEEDKTFLNKVSVVVTDYYFDDSFATGLDVGRTVKSLQPKIPVLLSSNGDFKHEQLKGFIDRVIPKDSISDRDLFLN